MTRSNHDRRALSRLAFPRGAARGPEGFARDLRADRAEGRRRPHRSPAPPERPSIAPDPSFGRLAIFFAANKETDIAGYNIYRSTDPNLPKQNWTKLNQELLTRTNFRDEKVESGKTYYYYIVAVDNAGNVSQPSEVASETVP